MQRVCHTVRRSVLFRNARLALFAVRGLVASIAPWTSRFLSARRGGLICFPKLHSHEVRRQKTAMGGFGLAGSIDWPTTWATNIPSELSRRCCPSHERRYQSIKALAHPYCLKRFSCTTRTYFLRPPQHPSIVSWAWSTVADRSPRAATKLLSCAHCTAPGSLDTG
jgi:hypothetical protein